MALRSSVGLLARSALAKPYHHRHVSSSCLSRHHPLAHQHNGSATTVPTVTWTQRRCLSLDPAGLQQLNEQILAKRKSIWTEDAIDFMLHHSPPAYACDYITWLSTYTGGHWPSAVALAVLSVQPIVLPVLIHFRTFSTSIERALVRYRVVLDDYMYRLKRQKDYGEAWRVYRAKRDMLKESGFWLPRHLSLSLVEVPLLTMLAGGAAVAAYRHDLLGSFLWLYDFGALDPTYLSGLIFFATYGIRVVVGSSDSIQSLLDSRLVIHSAILFAATWGTTQFVPAIVFWLGTFHNMMVLPVAMYLRQEHVFHRLYVPRLPETTQAIVQRDARGEGYLLPHATKIVDRFAPEVGHRPLLLPDFDPDKVPPPTVPALMEGPTETALSDLKQAETKRLAVAEARTARKPKVRRK